MELVSLKDLLYFADVIWSSGAVFSLYVCERCRVQWAWQFSSMKKWSGYSNMKWRSNSKTNPMRHKKRCVNDQFCASFIKFKTFSIQIINQKRLNWKFIAHKLDTITKILSVKQFKISMAVGTWQLSCVTLISLRTLVTPMEGKIIATTEQETENTRRVSIHMVKKTSRVRNS